MQNFNSFINTPKGQFIQKKFKLNEIDDARDILVSGIVDEYIYAERSMGHTDYTNLTKDIINKFPSESASYYYTSYKNESNKTVYKGRLYSRFKNQARKILKSLKNVTDDNNELSSPSSYGNYQIYFIIFNQSASYIRLRC